MTTAPDTLPNSSRRVRDRAVQNLRVALAKSSTDSQAHAERGMFQHLLGADMPVNSPVQEVKTAAAVASAPTEVDARLKLLTRAGLSGMQPVRWLIRGILPAVGIAAVYGPSGSGKSFLALDALCAVAEGTGWFDYKVVRAPVVYIALEGTAGINQRVEAWERKHERSLPAQFRFVFGPLALSSDVDVRLLAEGIVREGFGNGIVVIDTLNQAAPESDENSSQDMGRLIKNAKILQKKTGGLVLLVHHTGKDSGRGLRGHSSLQAALDAVIEVSRPAGARQWTLAKSKDGADGMVHPFKLEIVPLDVNQDGDQRSSCVVVPAPQTPAGSVKKAPQGGNQHTALTILESLLRSATAFGQAQAPTSAPCVKELDAISAVASGLVTADPKRKRERAEAAIRGLIGRGLIACSEAWIWAT